MLARIVSAAALCSALLVTPGAVQAQGAESILVPNNGPGVLPMGTIKGEQVKRLVIRNATIVSGRGAPGSPRAMPPEGPVDIVIENGVIIDIVLMDAVNAAGNGPNFKRPTGDRIIDAKGMYVIPGLVEMHAHLPPVGNDLGPRGLDYAYRLYLGHGVTTVRDAGSGAGLKLLAEARTPLGREPARRTAPRALPALAPAAPPLGHRQHAGEGAAHGARVQGAWAPTA